MSKKKKTQPKFKTKGLFDHLNAIYTDQSLKYWDNLDDINRKSYSTFMINRFLSMNMDYVEMVNLLQRYYDVIGPRESYLFYSQSGAIPRRRQFNRYIGKNTNDQHPDWILDLVARHYNVSKVEAESYLELYRSSDEGREQLQHICSLYGVDPKKVNRL